MEIAGKIVLVLGAAKGIGKEVGLALAGAGATVVHTWYDWPDDAERTRWEFADLGRDHLSIQVDLRDPDQVRGLFDRIRQQFGRLHILFNNIERGGMPIVHGPYVSDQWDMEMATTLKAKWLVFQDALPLLKKNAEGVVINVSSIAGLVGRTGPAGQIFNDGYAAANRGVSSFTELWAREAAPTVRVNELMLGFIETRHGEKTRGWDLLTEEQQQAVRDHTLLQKTGRLDDVVKAVFFLIKDAPFMTGARILLDGGYILGGEMVPPMPKGVL